MSLGTGLAGNGGAAPTAAAAGALAIANNLSDLNSASTSRTNLGLAAIAASGSASDLSAGTVPTARFPGGAFNGVSELVQLDGAGKMPALDGSALTALNGTNVASGTVADARLSTNVGLLTGTQTFTGAKTFSGGFTVSSTVGSFGAGVALSGSLLTLSTGAGGRNALSAGGGLYVDFDGSSAQTINFRDSSASFATVASLNSGGTMTLKGGTKTTAITSGALPTVTLTSGTGAQIVTTRDVTLVIAVTATGAAGTCTIALSPDNVTYSNVVVSTPGIQNGIDAVTLAVPAGWYVKVTDSSTTHTATYY